MINTGIDRITGYPINSSLVKALAFDFNQREEIDAYQQEKFLQLTSIAAKSDFYSGYAGKSLNDFVLIDREAFCQHFDRLKTGHVNPVHVQKSSGSTGSPVWHYITSEMLLAKRVSHQKMLRWHGLQRESPEVKFGGMPANFKTRLYYRLRNKLFFNSYNISDRFLLDIIRQYNRFKPSVLYGYPSMIHKFAAYSLERGIALRPPEIIVSHAENLYEEYRSVFQNVFPGVPIINQYWSTEANIAETCPHGHLHIDEDTVICEVTDQDENGVGNLFITNLFSYALPLIRYKIGDRVKLSIQKCTCGRNTQVIEYIEGREIEYIDLPDGRQHPVTAIYMTQLTGNILTYQLIHYKQKKTIEVRYIPIVRGGSIEKKKITEHMKKRFGLNTIISETTELENSPGGKIKRLIVHD